MAAIQASAQAQITPDIRQLFADVVPPRRLAYTRTLSELLTVLESQQLLTQRNVDLLVRCLPDWRLRTFVEEQFVQMLRPESDRNLYAEMHQVELQAARNSMPYLTSRAIASALPPATLRSNPTYYDVATAAEPRQQPPHPQHAAENGIGGGGVYCPPEQRAYQQHAAFTAAKRAIYAMLAEDIGKMWRNLGRELGVPEGRLDDIDEQHRGQTADKVHAMLQQFERRTVGPRHQCDSLDVALQQVRRRDLAKRMREMLGA